MTVYLKVLKQLILDLITHARDKSNVADKSLGNTIFNFFGKGRNLELSGIKKDRLLDLYTAIDGMKPSDYKNDDEIHKALQGLITEYKEELRLNCRSEGSNEGNTGKSLTKALNLITVVKTDLKDLNLLDVKLDDSLVSKLRYHLALFPITVYANDYNHLSFNDRYQAVTNALQKLEEAIPKKKAKAKPPARNTRKTRARGKVQVEETKVEVEETKVDVDESLSSDQLLEIVKGLKEQNDRIDKMYKVDGTLPISKAFNDMLATLPDELILDEYLISTKKP